MVVSSKSWPNKSTMSILNQLDVRFALTLLALASFVPNYEAFSTSLWSQDPDLLSFHNESQVSSFLLSRNVRQATTHKCRRAEWACANGQCIPLEDHCDGIPNCKDGSDETFVTCRNKSCASIFFHCTYGACVNSDAKCNGIRDCADNSDELHKDCRKDEVKKCDRRSFQCDNEECIEIDQQCDGVVDCADGSDETVKHCTGRNCPARSFKCAYGACVDSDSNCNNRNDCADGSDELPELCRGVPGYIPMATITTTTTTTPPPTGDYCLIPPLPANGNYKVAGKPVAPGSRVNIYESLIYHCDKNYYPIPSATNLCDDGGMWTFSDIQCLKKCKGISSSTVILTCSRLGEDTACEGDLISGTIVNVKCKNFHIISKTASKETLKCVKGDWDYPTPECIPECGEEKIKGTGLSINSYDEERGKSPWHVAIYRKIEGVLTHSCGGTIITNTIVISAAHCFHIDSAGKILDPSNFAVGAGKYYRSWDHEEKNTYTHVQRFMISKIFTPDTYGGLDQSLQQDIALVILEKQLEFSIFVHPVCLNLDDPDFQRLQLTPGNLGKGVGWGVTIEGHIGSASENLKAVTIPVVDYNTCRTNVPATFKRFLTVDKFCAGWLNGTALCSGDSGGGLVFDTTERGVKRYYLRGIVSVSDLDETKTTCRKDMYTAFTNVYRHKDFIKEILLQNQ